jgi:hypothetical protein
MATLSFRRVPDDERNHSTKSSDLCRNAAASSSVLASAMTKGFSDCKNSPTGPKKTTCEKDRGLVVLMAVGIVHMRNHLRGVLGTSSLVKILTFRDNDHSCQNYACSQQPFMYFEHHSFVHLLRLSVPLQADIPGAIKGKLENLYPS